MAIKMTGMSAPIRISSFMTSRRMGIVNLAWDSHLSRNNEVTVDSGSEQPDNRSEPLTTITSLRSFDWHLLSFVKTLGVVSSSGDQSLGGLP